MRTVSSAQAARHLAVTPRTIRSYRRRGVLRVVGGGLSLGDVLLLERERRMRRRLTLSRQTFSLLHLHAARLEHQVQTVISVIDLGCGGRLTRDEVVTAYRAAQHGLAHGWPMGSAPTWAAIFARLTYRDLQTLRRGTGDTHPWRVLYRAHLDLAPQISVELGESSARATRFRLTGLALRWIERGEGRRRLQLLVRESGGEPNRRLIRQMRRHC